jgi:squalene cyclase
MSKPIALAAALALGPLSTVLFAQGADPEKSAVELITPEADEAVQNGLRWLAGRQHDDGSFGSDAYHGNVAVTALSGMAMMAGGSTPDRGPYGSHVTRAVDYLLARTQESGFVTDSDSASHGPMYGHGFATLFLAECYGMSLRPELREKLTKSVNLIVNTQNKDGGWRYYPQRDDADISVTICQVMALRAARNAGLFVPNETIDRCTEYVKKSQNADGGFRYMLHEGRESAFPRSAAGVVALYSAGIYEGPEIGKGLEYLMQFLPSDEIARREPNYFYYGHYYAVQATWQAGGDYWARWYPAIREELLSRRRPDGSWTSLTICPEYATAMSLLVLQLPENLLPIFQR